MWLIVLWFLYFVWNIQSSEFFFFFFFFCCVFSLSPVNICTQERLLVKIFWQPPSLSVWFHFMKKYWVKFQLKGKIENWRNNKITENLCWKMEITYLQYIYGKGKGLLKMHILSFISFSRGTNYFQEKVMTPSLLNIN